ncbi:hypothetical protein D3C83_55160 [compost metagenome]
MLPIQDLVANQPGGAPVPYGANDDRLAINESKRRYRHSASWRVQQQPSALISRKKSGEAPNGMPRQVELPGHLLRYRSCVEHSVTGPVISESQPLLQVPHQGLVVK